MSALSDIIKKNGGLPQCSLVIHPLDGSPQINLTRFLSYQFTNSVLIPVDQFQFTLALPDAAGGIDDYIVEGDVAELHAAGTLVCTGIVDTVTVETTIGEGDIVTITGRNLLGQLEDNNAVNTQTNCIWGSKVPVQTTGGSVIQNTRIRGLIIQQAPGGSFLFATEPGETKLSALSRYVEPLNCIFWGSPNGYLVIGRPNMSQANTGSLFCDRDARKSNVLSMKVTYAATQIPNTVLSVWSGQEAVASRVSKSQIFANAADGPSRLNALGHFVQRCVVVSTPSGSDPQSQSDYNNLTVGNGNLLSAYALREIARCNITEISVQAHVKGHYNDDLVPFLADQMYQVGYPRGSVDEAMYAHTVDYSCDIHSGPRTTIHLCRTGSIVAGISKHPVSNTIVNSSQLATL